MPKTLVLCSCEDSQAVDAAAFASLEDVTCSRVHTSLCTKQLDGAAEAIEAGGALIACAQERQRFEELAEDLNVEAPLFIDLRDRAGWSDDGNNAGPKMAALVADALRQPPPVKVFDVTSQGLCLILGAAEISLAAAERLAPHLGVTVLLEDANDIPLNREFDVVVGRLKNATGSLGNFDVAIDRLQQVQPGGRGAFSLGPPRNGGKTQCDIILDLRDSTPLFPAPHKREGYLRADPGRPDTVSDAVLEASHLIGTFEKPLYLSLNPVICAHSRAQKIGCSKCLDVCPTGAAAPAGDHVTIDPEICAGCGSCAALCPSGAITFDDPPSLFLFERIRGLGDAYRDAGGDAPRLLVCDRDFGLEMISLAARFGRGLPANVIPLDLERISGFGHAEMLTALACGFSGVDMLLSPRTEREALTSEHALASALAGDKMSIRLLEPIDPDALSDALYEVPNNAPVEQMISPVGTRRQVTHLAVNAIRGVTAEPIPLPESAPYGSVDIDRDACTLCLSCVSLCPSGALGDNPDMPQLRFTESACLQCGLCTRVCPENAVSLRPQFDLSIAALNQRVLHEEEPYTCVECGKPFGVKSTIEKIVEKLAEKHSMFATGDKARLIRMCDDCRINAQYHSKENPFEGAERPRVRTTEDYIIRERRDH